jgi:predicted transcriptional regulator YdeE
MELQSVNKKYVIGISTRTKNEFETDMSTSRIGPLWGSFYQEDVLQKIPNKKNDVPIAVYSEYESDHTGLYTLLVGAEIASMENIPEGMKAITIEPGKYLVFIAEGKLPQSVMKTWTFIWDYFSKSSEYQRSYSTDFEVYTSMDRVEIYVAVK